MATASEAKSFTVRFPNTLHHAMNEAAARSQLSMNALLQDIVEAWLRQEEERRLYASFTQSGEDLAECDVEYAWEAQKEAIDCASPLCAPGATGGGLRLL